MARAKKKRRYRNHALWISLVAQGALLTQLLGVLLGWNITPEEIDSWVTVGNIVLGILSTLGIISNPTKPDSKGYNL